MMSWPKAISEDRPPLPSGICFHLKTVVRSLFLHAPIQWLFRLSIAELDVGVGSTEWCSPYIWRDYSRGQPFPFDNGSLDCRSPYCFRCFRERGRAMVAWGL